jgi:organic radical activating enzyme
MEDSLEAKDIVKAYSMPFYFHSLVVESTDRCNANCAICYQDARSSTEIPKKFNTLSLEDIVNVIEQAALLPNLNRRFHLAGGEAFLEKEKSLKIYSAAKENGFINLTGTTNGYWAKNRKSGLAFARQLKHAGVTSLEISADIWHQNYVKPDTICNCIDVCKEVGIATTLRMLANKRHSHQEAMSTLRIESLEKADRITCGKVFYVGRARQILDANDFYQQGASGKCFNMLNLAVSCRGGIFPCCAGLDQSQHIGFGTIWSSTIRDAVDNMSKSDVLRMIVFLGAENLSVILSETQNRLPRPETFSNMCELCWLVFSKEHFASKIKQHFLELEHKSIDMALQYLAEETSNQL